MSKNILTKGLLVLVIITLSAALLTGCSLFSKTVTVKLSGDAAALAETYKIYVENDETTAALVSILSGEGAYTVFAPTDAAFQALYTLAGVADFGALVEAVGIGTIETVLKYHVLGSIVFSSDIPNALDGNASVALVPLSEGSFTLNSDLSIMDSDGALSIGTADASIVNTDIFATNGVIHVIDQVLLP